MIRPALHVVLALLLVTSGFTGFASANDIVDIDENTALGKTAPDSFEESGSARADLLAPDMSIWVVEDAEQCGYEGKTDARVNKYVCVEYREELPKTVRFDIHESYMTPVIKDDLEALDEPLTADMEPVVDGDRTRVTLQFDGPTKAVFAVNKGEAAVQGWWAGVLERVTKPVDEVSDDEDVTETDWEYVTSSELVESEYRIPIPEQDARIEYDADSTDGERWRPVPDNPNRDPPVYYYTKVDDPDAVYVVSESSDGVPIRYKQGTTGFWGQGFRDLVDGILNPRSFGDIGDLWPF